jgi:hypothetical protein
VNQIFLCYARQDEAKVSALYENLSSVGFQPFMAPKDIMPGEDWKQVIMNTIREAPFFLACLSNNSVDRRGVIQEEIREALEMWRQKLDSDIYFIPVRLEDCSVPGALAKFQWVDLFHESGFERLVMALNIGMERLGTIRAIRLRSQSLENLSEDDVKLMLQENGFYEKDWHWMGKGIRHQYKLLQDGKVVFDQTTSLTWLQSSSERNITIEKARQYILDLNTQRFAGYKDWRLPTLEEAMSLVEPRKYHGLHLDRVFDSKQTWIWTADKKSAGEIWGVFFTHGFCRLLDFGNLGYVRAVFSHLPLIL